MTVRVILSREGTKLMVDYKATVKIKFNMASKINKEEIIIFRKMVEFMIVRVILSKGTKLMVKKLQVNWVKMGVGWVKGINLNKISKTVRIQ